MERDQSLSILFDVFVLAQRTRQLLAEAMSSAPLTADEYAIHSAIDHHAPISTSDLARELGMPVTTLHDHVHGLLERGHVERRRDPRDRRAQLLSLSPSGTAAHQRAGRSFDRALAPITEALRLPPDQVRDALRALTEACEAATDTLQLQDAAA